MKLQLQLLSLEHFHSPTVQVVLQKFHDIIKWPFLFHCSLASWFFSFDFLLSLIYLLLKLCHLSLHFWDSDKESLFQVSCQWGIICIFGILLSSWKEYSTGHCTWVWESHLEGTATDIYIYIYIYIYITVPTSEEWLRIADEFNEICKMPNCIGSRDALSNAHQTPDFCILITKAFTQWTC